MFFSIRSHKHQTLYAGVSALALTIALGASTGAQAQTTAGTATANHEGLEEVVVTAERRSSDVQKTATSITVESGEDLLQRGKYTLSNILETVPGVYGGASDGVSNNPTGNDSPATGITIRGVASSGTLSGQTVSTVPATAVYVDDVYGGVGGDYDIDRVEILRGPQGTLYGRSATAGLIAIHTHDPDLEDYSFEGSAEIGSYNLTHLSGAVNVPIIDDELALRISGNHYAHDGYNSQDGYGAVKNDDIKAKLLFQPTSNFSVVIGGAIEDRRIGNGGATGNMVTPDKWEYTSSPTGSARTRYDQIWGEAKWNLGGVNLTYIPSYRTWTQNGVVYVYGPGGDYIEQVVKTPHDTFNTQEFRISSDDNAWFKWQTGIFYYANSLKSSNINEWQDSKAPLYDAEESRSTRDFGVFAEGTIPITDNLRLTAGARYDKTTVKTQENYTSNLNALCNTPIGAAVGCTSAAVNSGTEGLPEDLVEVSIAGDAGLRKFTNETYKARLEYDVSPDSLLYGSVSSAFLPGDVQIGTGTNEGPAVSVYKAEQLTAFEVGSKNRFLDNRLQLNGSLFYYDYAGYQVSILLNTSDPGSGYLYNVPMHMWGGELESIYQVTSQDLISLNMSYVGSRFHNAPSSFSDYADNKGLWGFSPFTSTLSYEHDFPLANGSNIALRGEGIWRSGYDVSFISASLDAQGGRPYVHQNGFFLGNLNVTWTSSDSRFSLTGYVRNITDKRYTTYVNLQSVSPLDSTGNQSDPRTFGAIFTTKF